MTRARDLAAFVSNADGDIKFDTDTLFIDSSANRVGIGTTTPSEQINLVGSSGASKIRFDGDSSNLQNNFIGITGYDDLVIASDEANSGSASTIQFKVDSTERMRINDSGNVGIKTTSPVAPLHVDSDNSFGIGITGAADDELTISASADTDQAGAFDSDRVEIVRFLSGGGITFNGDTAAANALDDYENGQWTPTLSATGRTFTLSTNVGRYVKIGDLVHLTGRIDVSAVSGSSTASVKIEGIPYSIPNANEVQGGMTPMQGYFGTTDRVMIYIPANANYLSLYKNDHTAAYNTLAGNDVTTFDSIIFSVTYISAT